jgi:hypothetical protein
MPDHNFPVFFAVEQQLMAEGCVVNNPAAGVPPDLLEYAISLGPAFRETDEYQALIVRDLRMVEASTDIAVLPGWEESSGALGEIMHGQKLGLAIWHWHPEILKRQDFEFVLRPRAVLE